MSLIESRKRIRTFRNKIEELTDEIELKIDDIVNNIISILQVALKSGDNNKFKENYYPNFPNLYPHYHELIKKKIDGKPFYIQLLIAFQVLNDSDITEGWSVDEFTIFKEMVPNAAMSEDEFIDDDQMKCKTYIFDDSNDVVRKKLLESEWYEKL